MIEFFAFSWVAHIVITFILGVCVLTQTLTIVLNFYRRRLSTTRIFESLLEIFILIEILIFSLLHGQVVGGYKNGFVVPGGYETIRMIVFILILILVILVCNVRETLLPFSLIPAVAISLPIMEKVIGSAFPWFFIMALLFFLVRSIEICVSSVIAIRTNISALSVINAIDSLHTGVLFSESDGYILLANRQIQNLMLVITGKVFRNAIQFYEMLVSDEYELSYKKAELDGPVVYLLNNGTAWMFTKTDISFRMKNYIHISAADVSEQWELTAKLQNQDEELRHKSHDLKNAIANLHIISQEREIENAKMRAHDVLGQRLSAPLRIIQNEEALDYDLLTSLSKGLLDEIKSKAKQREIGPYDELRNIQQIFAAIGVEIKFQGELPDNNKQASLFIDIIREGCTNAVRHGFATEINIKVKEVKNKYSLTIANNGRTITAPITAGSGIGGMRKKVGDQGGHLEIIYQPQFTLSVVLPGGD